MVEPTHYSSGSNSNKSKKAAENGEVAKREPLKPIIVGKAVVKKESVGRKFLHSFAGDSLQSTAEHLVFNVVVPNTKTLISDLIRMGVDRILFGESGRNYSSATARFNGGTTYSGMYKGGTTTTPTPATPSTPQRERGKNIIFDSRADASAVLDQLQMILDQYSQVWVRDLYELVDISPAYTDEHLGWRDLSSAKIVFIGPQEHLLDLPLPERID